MALCPSGNKQLDVLLARQSSPVNHIANLTALRFFAALAVLLSHFRGYLTRVDNEVVVAIANEVLPEGFIGVTFFYVLSGFILNYNYTEKITTKSVSWVDFLAFRCMRLYPVHWLFLAASIPLNTMLFAKHGFLGLGVMGLNAMLLQSLIPTAGSYFSFNMLSWSLSDEMFFYCLFCVIVGFRINTLYLIVAALLVLITISLAACQANNCTADTKQFLFYINPAYRFIDFVIGIVLARIFDNRAKRGGIEPILGNHTKKLSVLFLFLFIAGALIGNVPLVYRYDIFYILPMSLIIFVFAEAEPVFPKFVEFLGEASFSLYMSHLVLMRYFDLYFETGTMTDWKAIACFSSMLCLSIGLSCVIFKYYEHPINLYLRRTWKNRFS